MNELSLISDLLVRMGRAFIIAFVVAAVIAPPVIKILKKCKLEQVFRDQNEVRDLAKLHSGKAHTPTMGGIIIIIATFFGTIFSVHWNFQVMLTLSAYLAIAVMGFIDDFKKIRARNVRGISVRGKLLIQLMLVLGVAITLRCHPDFYAKYCSLPIPFLGYTWTISCFILLVIFLFFVLSGTSNAVNLTDGLDGLATSCAIPVLLFFMPMAVITGSETLATFCSCSYISGSGELAVVGAATLGALVVFLWHNGYPASIFMGDMGSLSLGVLMAMIAFLTNHPFHLVIAGGIFVMEALSDIIQVFSFKFCGKRRVFKMAPIHHHFELLGTHEAKITRRFGMISWLLSGLSIIGLLRFFK